MLSSMPSATARASSSASRPTSSASSGDAVDEVRAQRAVHRVVEVLRRQLGEQRPQLGMGEHAGERVALELRARIERPL